MSVNTDSCAVTIEEPTPLGMTAQGISERCDHYLTLANSELAQLRALNAKSDAELTSDVTLGRFDTITLFVQSAGEFPYLMSMVHPDLAVRDAAKECEPKTDSFMTELWMDVEVASVMKRYANKNETLPTHKQRLLHDIIREFRRNGLELNPDEQTRLREINTELTTLGQSFLVNISSSRGQIRVPPTSLEGLPEDYIQKHPLENDGLITITTDYPDFFPFATYSTDRKSARELYIQFTNRGGDENIALLDRILSLRNEKAQLLGYKTWADYAIEPRMAKTPETVYTFLEGLKLSLKGPSKAEFSEFVETHVQLGGKPTDPLSPVERYYLEDRIRTAKYQFNTKELSNYFEMNAVTQGILEITSRIYGITFKEDKTPAWHADVRTFEIIENNERIGKFYLDLHPRADKYKHAAMFSVRTPKRFEDGSWVTPIAALVCNFPKPGALPALLSHDEVQTYFHEFGHVLHHLLTQSPLASFAGTNTTRDFVETPSQMFEEWAFNREVLDLFAKHHKTGEPIPEPLFQAMLRARSFGRALGTQRQLFLASFDLALHSRKPGFNTTALVKELQSQNESFQYIEGTHFQSSFGHLIGYDAGYYSYQWALSLSRDVLTRFQKEGLMNPATAASFRKEVLAHGGGEDENVMLENFLGRPPSAEAYAQYLKGV